MVNLWTTDEINNILMQLDDRKLPFSAFSFARTYDNRISVLGHGGSADVYEAVRRFGKKGSYALKVIGFKSQNVETEYFKDSTRLQKRLGNAALNVVNVYDYTQLWVTLDESDNVVSAVREKPEKMPQSCILLQFILMERLECVIERTKAGNIRMTPDKLSKMDEREVIKLAYDIGEALKNIHKSKALHRDVKLENVFYSKKLRHYKLGDFGIAKKTKDGFAGTVAFTKGYAAPEVLHTPDNDRYDSAADIYSFGIMLYVLMNGLKFPDSRTYNVNYDAQYSSGYVLPRPEWISQRFYEIILKLCMYNPEERYQSMEEVLVELEELLYGDIVANKRKNYHSTMVMGVIMLVAGAACRLINGDFNWVAFTFISFGAVLLLQCGILSYGGRFYHKVWFKTGLYWVGVFSMYSLCIMWTFQGIDPMNAKMLGEEKCAVITSLIEQYRLWYTGVAGLCMSAAWIVHEKWMKHFKP